MEKLTPEYYFQLGDWVYEIYKPKELFEVVKVRERNGVTQIQIRLPKTYRWKPGYMYRKIDLSDTVVVHEKMGRFSIVKRIRKDIYAD